MNTITQNNKRLVKNTLMLYMRTIIVMIVTLYMSRLILDVLGVEDYGIYNVVGGAILMFHVLSGALSSAISRFITFELGKGDKNRLKSVFSTSLIIQLSLSVFVLIVGESLGWWFLSGTLDIPIDRLAAAYWVMHCAILMFIFSLLIVPFNACIVAHERMTAFAYISILDVFLKLIAVILLYYIPFDRLKLYAFLLVIASLIVQLTYISYCYIHFEEVRGRMQFDLSILKKMSAFAGWNFLTNGAYVFNTQGINILINVFFGVGANAARGIASQVEGAVMKFVGDFTTAINPQITKSYARGELENVYSLVCRGAKFGFFLLLIISLPILMETETILSVWLKVVPDHTVAFVRLAIIATMIDRLGITGYTACMATGHIKNYVLCISAVGCLVFPLTWLSYEVGMPVESAYVVFALVYVLVTFVRLYIMKGLLNFPVMRFVREVFLKILIVASVAIVVPMLVVGFVTSSLYRFVFSTIICLASSMLTIYYLGLTTKEKQFIGGYISKVVHKFHRV